VQFTITPIAPGNLFISAGSFVPIARLRKRRPDWIYKALCGSTESPKSSLSDILDPRLAVAGSWYSRGDRHVGSLYWTANLKTSHTAAPQTLSFSAGNVPKEVYQKSRFDIQSTSAAGPILELMMGAKQDYSCGLQEARHESGDSIHVRFTNGREGIVSLTDLGLNAGELDMNSAVAAPDGAAVEIKSHHGDLFPIDVSILRALIDSRYSAALGQPFAPHPNMDMLRALVKIGIIQKDMHTKDVGKSSKDYVREAREGGMYGIRSKPTS
jgi:hypothetical protein